MARELTTDDIVASLTYVPGDLVREKPSRTVGPPKLGLVVAVDPLADRAQALVVWGTVSGRILETRGFYELQHWTPEMTAEQATELILERKEWLEAKWV